MIFEKNGEKNGENWLENEFCILPPLQAMPKYIDHFSKLGFPKEKKEIISWK